MCGIFGWSYERGCEIESGKRETLASVLATANAMRGEASWGVYAFGKREGWFVRREVGSISKASGVGMFGTLRVAMLHTRWPTSGKVIRKNAHPFRVGKIILAHNGIVSNEVELSKKYPERRIRVDSQHLAYHLNETRDMKEIEGYGAIEYVNLDEPSTIYICRMRSGSLSVYGLKKNGQVAGVAWSSDKDHLKSALGAARIDCFPYDPLEEGRIYSCVAGHLFVHDKEAKLEISGPTYSVGYNYGPYSDWWEKKEEEEEESRYGKRFLARGHGHVRSMQSSYTTVVVGKDGSEERWLNEFDPVSKSWSKRLLSYKKQFYTRSENA